MNAQYYFKVLANSSNANTRFSAVKMAAAIAMKHQRTPGNSAPARITANKERLAKCQQIEEVRACARRAGMIRAAEPAELTAPRAAPHAVLA